MRFIKFKTHPQRFNLDQVVDYVPKRHESKEGKPTWGIKIFFNNELSNLHWFESKQERDAYLKMLDGTVSVNELEVKLITETVSLEEKLAEISNIPSVKL